MIRSVLHVQQVLAWADEHFARTGNWPRKEGGRVHGAPDEKWHNIDMALRQGHRGFPGGWSLPQLLAEHRGVRNHVRLPRLTIKQILAWVDAHRRRTGEWPRVRSGAICKAPGETWLGVNLALTHGGRGLRGGSPGPIAGQAPQGAEFSPAAKAIRPPNLALGGCTQAPLRPMANRDVWRHCGHNRRNVAAR